MFSRKRPRHVRPDDAPPSDALAQSLAGEDDVAPERGPYDVKHAPAGVARLDLGSLQIPAVEGVEVRVQASPDGVIEHVVLVSGAGAVEFGAFAAPRSEGIWDEVREEMVKEMAAANITAREVDGTYGREVVARLPDPQGQLVDVRYVGVDGPRWFVKATFQGPVAVDMAQAPVLAECLEGLVVVRDDEPRPVREPLPMRLPQEMTEQAQGAPAPD
jgi:uncharacterized protein DUF3710